ncbi:MAG TPA: hypothetical protein VJ576_00075 [Rhodocyclaceae bacterium]|nr:hypothetical protein [Rhodocyclaceae bacterium]
MPSDLALPLPGSLSADLQFMVNRIGTFAILFLLDDPAMLAMWFC